MTRFFNKGHPLPSTFLVISYSISAQTLNKYSTVVVLVAIYFSTKKICIITKYNDEKVYDVNRYATLLESMIDLNKQDRFTHMKKYTYILYYIYTLKIYARFTMQATQNS